MADQGGGSAAGPGTRDGGEVQLLDQEREMAGAKGRGHMYLLFQEQEIWVQVCPFFFFLTRGSPF